MKHQNDIFHEAAAFKDILQVNTVDSVANISVKHLLALGWAGDFCGHVPLLLLAEDDVFVNVFKLARFYVDLRERHRLSELLYCSVRTREQPVRDRRSRFYVSRAQYKQSTYPDYCQPFAHILTPDVAAKLYKASLKLPPTVLPVDAVYITGLLAAKAGVTHTRLDHRGGYGAVTKRRYTQITDTMFCLFQKKDNDYLQLEWPKYWHMLLKKYYMMRSGGGGADMSFRQKKIRTRFP